MAANENLPVVTPAPVFKAQELRRDLTLSAVWTPVVEGAVTNYNLFTCDPGSSISASSEFWRCCPASTTLCDMPTACRGNQFYYPSLTASCTATNLGCGMNFLVTSVGATDSYTQYFCATPGIAGNTYYIVSPNNAEATTAGNTVGGGTSATATRPASTTNTAANTAASSPKSGTSTSKAQFGTIAGVLTFLGLSALVLSL